MVLAASLILLLDLDPLDVRRDRVIPADVALAPLLVGGLLDLLVHRPFEMVVEALLRLLQELGAIVLAQIGGVDVAHHVLLTLRSGHHLEPSVILMGAVEHSLDLTAAVDFDLA